MKLIDTKNAPGAIGPYVQGYVVNGIVYTSGQIPASPADFNEVYAGYFTGKPARSCVAVKALPKGVLCEIEAIAEV